jgi:hypothetical protein
MLPCIPNLHGAVVTKRAPWAEPVTVQRSQFTDSVDYKQWASRPTTQHLCYSAVEGFDPSRRVTKDNEPAKLHGIVADYDAIFDAAEVGHFVNQTLHGQYPVSYVSLSYKRGIHAVWLFEEPVMVSGANIARKLLKRAAKEMGVNALARGWDEKCFHDFGQYYLHGWDWQPVSTYRIPRAVVNTWLFEAVSESDFRTDSNGAPEIPLDVVAAEVASKFPGRWQGPFTEGSRGVRFWDSGADNPTGAVVRATGMQCFTGDRPFVTWAEIFGGQFTAQFHQSKIGSAVDNVWHDGKNFWVRSANGRILPYDKANASLYFKVQHGFSGVKGKNENASELERALWTVVSERHVEGAMPFPFCKDAVVWQDNLQYVNVSQHTPVCQPDSNPRVWGDGFGWTASFIETLFGPVQLPYFLAWLAYFYQGAHAGKPRRGHAVFLAGGVNCGKTLLTNRVVGGLVGGFISPTAFMKGQTEFNDSLFEKGLWCIDDAGPASNHQMHAAYSARVKEVVANPSFVYHPKFCKPLKIAWSGRLMVTMNLDGDSIKMLPDLDANTRDKVQIYAANPHGKPFPGNVEDIIKAELPCLARWLLDYQIPTALQTNPRLGVSEYIDPQVESLALANSGSGHLIEIIDIWRKTFFTHRTEQEWVGSASELLVMLASMPGGSILLKDIGARNLAWGLRAATSQGIGWIKRENSQSWKVLASAGTPVKTTAAELEGEA